MKKLILPTLLLSYSLSPAWADEATIDAYATVDIYATAAENVIEAIPVVAPVAAAAPIQVPTLSREDNATLHLSLIRDKVDSMKDGGLFGGLFSSGSELQEALLQDIDVFLTIYNDLPIAAEALYLRGEIQQKQGYEEKAAISWLQTIFEFPETDADLRARESLAHLLENDWGKFKKEIYAIINKVPNENRQLRLNTLINQLFPLDDKDLIHAVRTLELDFLKRYSDSPHADEVQVLMSHNWGAESAESGIFGFKKVLALYPDSPYRAEAMLAIADLQRLRLKQYENAEANYKVLIQEYPEHKLAKIAYEHLALTQEKHLKKYHDAIATYQTIVAKYPEDKLTLLALKNMAALQEKKTKEPLKAIATLRQLATTFHSFEATDALKTAIKIADKKVKDPALAFEIRQQLVKDYPNSNEAPKALYGMAEYMEKSGHTEQAKSLYEQFMQTYPSNQLAKKVSKKLSKL